MLKEKLKEILFGKSEELKGVPAGPSGIAKTIWIDHTEHQHHPPLNSSEIKAFCLKLPGGKERYGIIN